MPRVFSVILVNALHSVPGIADCRMTWNTERNPRNPDPDKPVQLQTSY